MEKQLSAIPAFYACYLLRSTIRHASQYIGSTPNPKRRLGQHNGEARGGAARTARDSLRPWEMVCLVTGFPSKIAALQFEWAWQNTHTTRHVRPDSRLTHAKRPSPKAGRARKRNARPRLGLTDHLANLHLLLRAGSFERWPLKVTFYSPDVYKVWEKWTKQQVERLRLGIVVALDESAAGSTNTDSTAKSTVSGIRAVDVGYSSLESYLEKSQKAFENADWLYCAICQNGLPASGAMTLVCPDKGCNALTHMECLSTTFLATNSNALVPTSGQCPSCGTRLQWIDLVKELSLRMPRGEKELKAIFKKRRSTKKQAEAVVAADGEDDDDIADEPLSDDDIDDWHELSEESDGEIDQCRDKSDAGNVSKPTAFLQPRDTKNFPEPVIEDSDWDDADIIT